MCSVPLDLFTMLEKVPGNEITEALRTLNTFSSDRASRNAPPYATLGRANNTSKGKASGILMGGAKGKHPDARRMYNEVSFNIQWMYF